MTLRLVRPPDPRPCRVCGKPLSVREEACYIDVHEDCYADKCDSKWSPYPVAVYVSDDGEVHRILEPAKP